MLPLLLTLLTTFAPIHDYHVSKTNLRYVAADREIQVEMHLFVDDLEADMMAAGAPAGLEIGTARQHPEAERYLYNYLRHNFRVEIDGQRAGLQVIGYELDDDLHGLWIYHSTRAPAPPKTVAVSNSLLTGTYADQKNIVKVFNAAERVGTLLFSKERTHGVVEF